VSGCIRNALACVWIDVHQDLVREAASEPMPGTTQFSAVQPGMQRKDACMIAHCIRNLARAQQAGLSRSDTQLNGVHGQQSFCGAVVHRLAYNTLLLPGAPESICCSHYFEALNLLDSSGLGATEEERSGSSSSPALIRQVDRRAVNQACSSQILRSQRGVKLRFVVGILKRCTFHMFVYTKSAEHASALQPLADSAVPAANSCRATMSSLNTEHDS